MTTSKTYTLEPSCRTKLEKVLIRQLRGHFCSWTCKQSLYKHHQYLIRQFRRYFCSPHSSQMRTPGCIPVRLPWILTSTIGQSRSVARALSSSPLFSSCSRAWSSRCRISLARIVATRNIITSRAALMVSVWRTITRDQTVQKSTIFTSLWSHIDVYDVRSCPGGQRDKMAIFLTNKTTDMRFGKKNCATAILKGKI